jgi:hypothetical protein
MLPLDEIITKYKCLLIFLVASYSFHLTLCQFRDTKLPEQAINEPYLNTGQFIEF